MLRYFVAVLAAGLVFASNASAQSVNQGTGSMHTLTLNGSTSGGPSFTSPAVGGSVVFTMPSADGSANNCLETNGAAVLTFQICSGGGSGTVNSGTAGQVTYYAGTGTTVSGNSNLTISTGALTVGTASTTAGTVILEGGTSGALTLATQATAGTPTWTAGTSSGTPAVTASSPLAITTATGNITCATCNTSAATVTSITPAGGVASSNVGGTTAITTSGTLYADASFFPFYLGGLTLSNDGTTPTTVLDVAAGAAASDDIGTGGAMMKTAAITGSIAGTWTVGSGNNKLDTGTIAASTWYHVFEIERPDTSVVDILFSLSATSPTMPTNYTKKRRIGSFKTDGSSHILAFTQRGAIFYWAAQVLDVNASTFTTSRTLQTLASVPTGVIVQPLCRYTISNASTASVLLTSGDETDVAPTTTTPMTAAPGFDQLDTTLTAGDQNSVCPFLTTNTSGQIGIRASAASTTVSEVTRGWID